MDSLDLLAVQGTLKSLLQHNSTKASVLQHSAFFIARLSHPYMTTGKTIALTRRTFVGKVMSLLLNMLSRLVITFFPRSKRLLISWLVIKTWVVKKKGKLKGSLPGKVLPPLHVKPLLFFLQQHINLRFFFFFFHFWIYFADCLTPPLKNIKVNNICLDLQSLCSYAVCLPSA